MPLIVSDPFGALLALHDPDPPERTAMQSSVPPSTKVTVPLGVPVEPVVASVTVAW
jgi:hypothetical protein